MDGIGPLCEGDYSKLNIFHITQVDSQFSSIFDKKFMKRLFLLILLSGSTLTFAQSTTELVFVYFKDKPNKAAFYANPLSELSQKALDRRIHLGIALNDQDAPLELAYIQNIKNLGFTVVDGSKWLNGVAVNATPAQISMLENQSFVASVESFVKNPNGVPKMPRQNKFETFDKSLRKVNFNYGSATAQTDQINLRTLHQQGFTGQGITIAMLDTGFPTVNTGSPFARLRNAGKIKGGYNFVTKSSDIYNTSLHPHGAYCLGAIVGYVENEFVGSAPDVSVYLYATEDGFNEIPEEELYWIEGAEEADRQGVDIISASLGYATFDDPRYDYTYADMTGSRSFVARGAQIATEKGIFVLEANGNEALNSWHYLLTPADNTKVFSIGAVAEDGQSASFSSFGPNAVGAIKPDASARGVAAATVFGEYVTEVGGTSIATPIAAGGVACLLQAIPNSTAREEIRTKLRSTASLAPSFTNQMGFGILDFGKALEACLGVDDAKTQVQFQLYPNPNDGYFTIDSRQSGSYQLWDVSGKLLQTGNLKKGKNQVHTTIKKGVYPISVHTDFGKQSSSKVIVR